MKKLIALLVIVGVSLVGVAGCSKTEEKKKVEEKTETKTETKTENK